MVGKYETMYIFDKVMSNLIYHVIHPVQVCNSQRLAIFQCRDTFVREDN